MKYMIMRIKFEDNITEEEIDNITSNFYKDNEKAINGMTSDTLKNGKAFEEFDKIYNKWAK